MLARTSRSFVVFLIACFALPGCAYFTNSGRQQLAYEKYVRKQSGMRMKRQAKMRRVRVPSALLSEPKVSVGAAESPQSVTSAESQSSE
jgi:hypothetical protein